MRILLASSEAVPFSKTGGLADVATALGKALCERGHDVWLIVPNHRRSPSSRAAIPERNSTRKTISLRIAGKPVTAEILHCELPGSNLNCLLVDQPFYFDRNGLYQDPATGRDHKDNCERFVFFSRAVLEIAKQFDLRPDVIHANDWQTALVPIYMKLGLDAGRADNRTVGQSDKENTPIVSLSDSPAVVGKNTASILTIHNMAFQGQFWHWDMPLIGLDWSHFTFRELEYFGKLNLLKGGIVFADMITTVSPTYAREIQTPEYGAGLDGVLRERSADLVGILNGVDTEIWNPETDAALPKNYSVADFVTGKAACKAELQKQVGLPVRDDVPLFGMISRMTSQKGLDILAECAERVLRHDVQLSFLGTGDQQYEDFLSNLSSKHPDRVAVRIDFDDELAHRIEGGADGYLMPSRFEPCGLNQMYSLRYGTVPIVRAVGGLADSVVDTNAETLAEHKATGFRFEEYSSKALAGEVDRAMQTYRQKKTWNQLAETGMRQDLSWNRSAAEYEAVYRRAVAKMKGVRG